MSRVTFDLSSSSTPSSSQSPAEAAGLCSLFGCRARDWRTGRRGAGTPWPVIMSRGGVFGGVRGIIGGAVRGIYIHHPVARPAVVDSSPSRPGTPPRRPLKYYYTYTVGVYIYNIYISRYIQIHLFTLTHGSRALFAAASPCSAMYYIIWWWPPPLKLFCN